MENSVQGSQESCFNRWMNLQEQDLSELLHSLNISNADGIDHELKELIQKNITHFEDYINRRSTLAREHISLYFSPTWCTSLEGCMLWIGGCRPSIFIRLVYALCGNEISSNLDGYLQGRVPRLILGELSACQMSSINELQLKTIRKEDDISRKLASLQEDIADSPIAIIAKESRTCNEASEEAHEALTTVYASMIKLFEDADNMRLHTLKEMIGILTPTQGVEFLAASKKLHLCIHSWGRKKDRVT